MQERPSRADLSIFLITIGESPSKIINMWANARMLMGEPCIYLIYVCVCVYARRNGILKIFGSDMNERGL
jgi:hypothetical protein